MYISTRVTTNHDFHDFLSIDRVNRSCILLPWLIEADISDITAFSFPSIMHHAMLSFFIQSLSIKNAFLFLKVSKGL